VCSDFRLHNLPISQRLRIFFPCFIHLPTAQHTHTFHQQQQQVQLSPPILLPSITDPHNSKLATMCVRDREIHTCGCTIGGPLQHCEHFETSKCPGVSIKHVHVDRWDTEAHSGRTELDHLCPAHQNWVERMAMLAAERARIARVKAERAKNREQSEKGGA